MRGAGDFGFELGRVVCDVDCLSADDGAVFVVLGEGLAGVDDEAAAEVDFLSAVEALVDDGVLRRRVEFVPGGAPGLGSTRGNKGGFSVGDLFDRIGFLEFVVAEGEERNFGLGALRKGENLALAADFVAECVSVPDGHLDSRFALDDFVDVRVELSVLLISVVSRVWSSLCPTR